jgi:hypothetical protein
MLAELRQAVLFLKIYQTMIYFLMNNFIKNKKKMILYTKTTNL